MWGKARGGVGRCVGGVGEVWKSVFQVWGEVWEVCWGGGEVRKSVGRGEGCGKMWGKVVAVGVRFKQINNATLVFSVIKQ